MWEKKDEIDYDQLCKLADIDKQVLERKLLSLSQENADLQLRIKQAEDKLYKVKNNIDCERADSLDITNEMQRQFKQMQDELLKDIAEREKQIEQIRQQNQKEKESLQVEVEDRNKKIQEKEAQVMSLKKRLDQLSREFSAILRETLAQIADKIENKADDTV